MYTSNSFQKIITSIIIPFFFALITGYLLLKNFVLLGAFVLGITIFSLSLLYPKYLIYGVLFTSSFIGYIIPRQTLMGGTATQINFDGLRNLLIIGVSFPLIFFNIRRITKSKFYSPLIIFFILFSLTTLINFSIDNLRFYTRVISPILFYFLIIIFIRTGKDIDTTFNAIVFSSFIPIIVAMLQYVNILPTSMEKMNITEFEGRIDSTFFHPNTFGVYIVMFSFISIFKLFKEKGLLRIIRNIMYLLGVHLSLLMSLSRNSVFAICVTYPLIAKARWGTIRSGLIGLLLIVVFFSIPGFSQRLIMPSATEQKTVFEMFKKLDMQRLDEYSAGRISTWQEWIDRIKKSTFTEHLVGHGYEGEYIEGVKTFHNEFLKTYWINGMICCISFIYLVFYIVHRLYVWMKASFRRNIWDLYLLCAFGYAVAITFMSNFDNILDRYQLFIYFYSFIALAERKKLEETD